MPEEAGAAQVENATPPPSVVRAKVLPAKVKYTGLAATLSRSRSLSVAVAKNTSSAFTVTPESGTMLVGRLVTVRARVVELASYMKSPPK